MPYYEYNCSACGHSFELYSLRVDPPLPHCPRCNEGRGVTRALSQLGMVKIADTYDNLKKNTGCKGFEVKTKDGLKPMYNKYKYD